MKFEFETAPGPAVVQYACEGIRWCRMPLPFALDHVNCWLLGESDQLVLIDGAVNSKKTRELWSSVFSQTGGWPGHHLVTHFHPDHMGLAGWFESKGCEQFYGSKIETDIAHTLSNASDQEYAEVYRDWYTINGLPEEVVSVVCENGNTYRRVVHQPPIASKWRLLQEAQNITLAEREYEVIIGRGHAPDMIMLYRKDDHVLIAADQVLPSISPNVSVMPRIKELNPLHSFLQSLEQLKVLPEDTLVLPSHGLPFRGLHGRLQALIEHHDVRLEQVRNACAEPQTAHELFEVLFRRKLDAQQTSFALGESLAHLHYLEHHGQIQRLDEKGLTRFIAT